MTNYLDLHHRVREYVKLSETAISDSLITSGINAGLYAIMPWCPKRAKESIVVTSGSYIVLPDDVYQVEAIYDPDSKFWLNHFTLKNGYSDVGDFSAWYEYPTGYVSLTSEKYNGKSLDVFYLKSWDLITSGSDSASMDTPQYTDLALIYYACSYVFGSASNKTGNIRQFAQKIDSGTPDDNPLKDLSNLLMQRFLNEVKLFPTIERSPK